MRTLTFLFAIVIITLGSCMDDGGDTLLWDRSIDIALVDSETGEYLIGNAAISQYRPDSIVVYNESVDEVSREIIEDSGCYNIDIPMKKIFSGCSEILPFDTIFYVQLSINDIDTVHVTYEYFPEEDFYYMILNYNNVPYPYNNKLYTCGTVISKKVEEEE